MSRCIACNGTGVAPSGLELLDELCPLCDGVSGFCDEDEDEAPGSGQWPAGAAPSSSRAEGTAPPSSRPRVSCSLLLPQESKTDAVVDSGGQGTVLLLLLLSLLLLQTLNLHNSARIPPPEMLDPSSSRSLRALSVSTRHPNP